jgi:hypothetical protein
MSLFIAEGAALFRQLIDHGLHRLAHRRLV